MSLLEKLQVLSIVFSLFLKFIHAFFVFISHVEVLLSREINIRVSLQGFPTPITSALSMASPQSVHHFVFSGRKYFCLVILRTASSDCNLQSFQMSYSTDVVRLPFTATIFAELLHSLCLH